MSSKVSKSWCYTLNNYTDAECEFFSKLDCKRHRCGKEVGASGTPHLQGFITFNNATRLSALKKLNGRAHWEPAKAVEASLNYVAKESDIFIDVDKSQQGKRNDLHDAVATLKRTRDVLDVAEEHPAAFVKFHRGFDRLQQAMVHKECEKKDFPTEVHVYWGVPGSGKSRTCRELDPDLFCVPCPAPDGRLWWDGYRGQKTILFDDFYGGCKYSEMLRYLDRYAMQVPVKGGFVWRQWTQVFITSNKPPEMWYNRNECDALMRRITSVHELCHNSVL